MDLPKLRKLVAVAVALCVPTAAPAEVVRVDVQSREDFAAGRDFGSAFAYERLSGRIFFAVEPSNNANKIITDLDKAPRNGAGKVEFSSDFTLPTAGTPAWR